MLTIPALIDRQWPWVFPMLILLGAVFIAGVALISQYVGGNHPCTLCIAQRTSYVIAAIVAGAAAYMGRDDRRGLERAMLLGVCALAFVYGGVIAVQHVGVQQGWWSGNVLCEGDMASFSAGEVIIPVAENRFFNVPETTCAEGTWVLFGLSMAVYNVLANIILFGLSTAAALLGLRRTRNAS